MLPTSRAHRFIYSLPAPFAVGFWVLHPRTISVLPPNLLSNVQIIVICRRFSANFVISAYVLCISEGVTNSGFNVQTLCNIFYVIPACYIHHSGKVLIPKWCIGRLKPFRSLLFHISKTTLSNEENEATHDDPGELHFRKNKTLKTYVFSLFHLLTYKSTARWQMSPIFQGTVAKQTHTFPLYVEIPFSVLIHS